MITQIVAYVHFFDFPILIFTFYEHVFKEIVIMLLHFFIRHVSNQVTSIGRLRRILGVDVQVLQQACLRKRRLVVNARTAIAVTASADFEVEGAVYLVLFCAENRR